jgi:hypothetical protein
MPVRREYAGRAAMLLLAAVLATAGCGNGAPAGGAPGPEASSKERTTVDPGTGTAPACGQPVPSPGSGALILTGQFPSTTPAGAGTVPGTVEVTTREQVRGVALPRAEVFLARDGRVVTVPVPQDAPGMRWDLAPGAVERLPGEASLISCRPGGGAVPPGTYQVYARVVVNLDIGATLTSFGGPWPLEVH